MIAGIYARKSTEQAGVADEQKSVTRQVDHARAYAIRKGWTIDEASIFVDDGISGAEFENRPGFVRLLKALKPAPFTVLIVSELSRLGREQLETGYALKRLSVAGVRVFTYLDDREVLVDTSTNKFLLSAGSFGAELEREKARQRVTDAMLRKARAGHCCGGRVFGYDNVEIVDATGKRSHVERVVNPTEAAIVRRIFTLCAAGTGYTRIAKRLNAEHAPAPRPKAGRLAGWAPSSVKEILDRRLYLGEMVWNRTQKCDAWGRKHQQARPETDWIRTAAPALRIVAETDWQAAHGRLAGVRARLAGTGGSSGHRRARDIESAYLLSGFARCAVCGGGFGVTGGSHSSNRAHVYGCLAYHKRGTAVCGNGLRLPLERIDTAVLGTLAGDVLRPAVIHAVIAGVLDALEPKAVGRDVERSRAELARVERELERLTDAIAAGGDLASLVTALQGRQARQHALTATIAAGEASAHVRLDRRTVEARVREKLSAWRALLTKHVQDGRQLLREVLAGPLRFTPEGRTYRFEGDASIGRLLVGVAGLPTYLVAVRGFEPRSRG
jgi:site-specific DNA recombinase